MADANEAPDFLQAEPETFEALRYEMKHLQHALHALIAVNAVSEQKARQAYELTDGLSFE